MDYITDTAGFEFPTGTGSAKIEYARAMVFIALDEATGEMLDVARLHDNANKVSAEFAILVRSDLKPHGLGWQLTQIIFSYGRTKRLRSIEGQVLRENATMLEMCKELGFEINSFPDAGCLTYLRGKMPPRGPVKP